MTTRVSAKQKAKEAIKKKLEDDVTVAKHAVRVNVLSMRKLVDEQTVLKRKVVEIYKLIKTLESV